MVMEYGLFSIPLAVEDIPKLKIGTAYVARSRESVGLFWHVTGLG